MVKYYKDYSFFITSYTDFSEFDKRNRDNPVEDQVEYDKFLDEISKVDYLMTTCDSFALMQNYQQSTKPNRNFILFYFFKKSATDEEVEYYHNSIITYSYPQKVISVGIKKKITYDELNKLFTLAKNFGLNLLQYEGALITPQYLERLRLKEENNGPKLSKRQNDVLSNLSLAATWIFIPNATLEETVNFLGVETKESELVDGLFKSFEGGNVGIVEYSGNVVLFGNNVEFIPIKNLDKNIESEELSICKILYVMSIRFGEAQFYSYNKYERKYIHYRNGILHYLGIDGDDGPTTKLGTLNSEIQLTEDKVIYLAEDNGVDLETFLTKCFQNKITCHLFNQKNKHFEFFKNLFKR